CRARPSATATSPTAPAGRSTPTRTAGSTSSATTANASTGRDCPKATRRTSLSPPLAQVAASVGWAGPAVAMVNDSVLGAYPAVGLHAVGNRLAADGRHVVRESHMAVWEPNLPPRVLSAQHPPAMQKGRGRRVNRLAVDCPPSLGLPVGGLCS